MQSNGKVTGYYVNFSLEIISYLIHYPVDGHDHPRHFIGHYVHLLSTCAVSYKRWRHLLSSKLFISFSNHIMIVLCGYKVSLASNSGLFNNKRHLVVNFMLFLITKLFKVLISSHPVLLLPSSQRIRKCPVLPE